MADCHQWDERREKNGETTFVLTPSLSGSPSLSCSHDRPISLYLSRHLKKITLEKPCLVVHHPRPFLHHSLPKPPTTTIRASSSLRQAEIKSPSSIETIGGSVKPELLSSVAFPAIAASKRVILVRHGQSTWNEEGQTQGSSDYAVLTHKGEAQAKTPCQMLLTDTFHVCFHSPLIRSKKIAEMIWSGHAEEMILEFDLREINLYSFQVCLILILLWNITTAA
ncbi:hypothetical protein ACLOJK_037116 [Asimina triloba]